MITLITNKKERVIQMFGEKKAARNEQINTIYKANEATRRAISDLYTLKSERNKMVGLMAVVSLLVGIGIGAYFSIANINAINGNKSNVVELKVSSDTLKVQPQSEQK